MGGKKNLRENGATDEEIDFLLDQRVELNAFASDEFVEWIEGKLQQHGIAKVVPDGDTLAGAYGRMRRQALVQAQIDKLLTALEDEAELPIPEDLVRQIAQRLEDEPVRRWDAVLREIVENDHQKATS